MSILIRSIPSSKLLQISREQFKPYKGVKLCNIEVKQIKELSSSHRQRRREISGILQIGDVIVNRSVCLRNQAKHSKIQSKGFPDSMRNVLLD